MVDDTKIIEFLKTSPFTKNTTTEGFLQDIVKFFDLNDCFETDGEYIYTGACLATYADLIKRIIYFDESGEDKSNLISVLFGYCDIEFEWLKEVVKKQNKIPICFLTYIATALHKTEKAEEIIKWVMLIIEMEQIDRPALAAFNLYDSVCILSDQYHKYKKYITLDWLLFVIKTSNDGDAAYVLYELLKEGHIKSSVFCDMLAAINDESAYEKFIDAVTSGILDQDITFEALMHKFKGDTTSVAYLLAYDKKLTISQAYEIINTHRHYDAASSAYALFRLNEMTDYEPDDERINEDWVLSIIKETNSINGMDTAFRMLENEIINVDTFNEIIKRYAAMLGDD